MRYKTYPNPNARPLIDCKECGKKAEHQAKGMCYKCYKKNWKPREIICKSCGRKRPHKAFGLCSGCHVRLHHYEKTKRYNSMKYAGIDLERLQELTKKCVNCGFDKLIQIHHLDGDRNNKSDKNLVGLCPNCHKMIHSYEYVDEIKESLAKKGFDTEKINPSNYVDRKDEKNGKTR